MNELVLFLSNRKVIGLDLELIWQISGSFRCLSISAASAFLCSLLFTLAATVGLSSHTLKKVWGQIGVSITPIAHSQSRRSHVWRWCRMVQGLWLDYG
ncbi:hypothetical protein SUGI_0179320 [Cryptomeria japonica]|nr:hypothetical protein SUGI_0179320 [Cryptomeria japonica]